MTKLEKLYSIIENSRDVGVKLPKGVLQQVEELEEGIIKWRSNERHPSLLEDGRVVTELGKAKEEILPALSSDIAPRLNPIQRDLVLVVEYHPGEPISVALSRKTKISEMTGAKVLTPRSSTPVKSEEEPGEVAPHEPTKRIENVTKGMNVTVQLMTTNLLLGRSYLTGCANGMVTLCLAKNPKDGFADRPLRPLGHPHMVGSLTGFAINFAHNSINSFDMGKICVFINI